MHLKNQPPMATSIMEQFYQKTKKQIYPKTKKGRKGRRELAGMVDQLRALVDPPLGAKAS